MHFFGTEDEPVRHAQLAGKETLFTPTARAIAEERHRYMAEFPARLEREMKGEL